MSRFRQISRAVIWAAAVAAVALLAAYVSQRAGLSEYRTAGLNARAVAVLVPALVLFCFEPRRVRWGIVDILLVCLVGVYCLSALLNGQKVSLAVLQEAFPYVTLYHWDLPLDLELAHDGCRNRVLVDYFAS